MANRKVCPIFGKGFDLPKDVLPTIRSIFKFHFFLNTRNSILQVINELVNLWTRIGIPIISVQRIRSMLRMLWDEYRDIMKTATKKKKVPMPAKKKIDMFRSRCLRIFDIASCKCEINKCTCDKAKKVPENLQDFLRDQRTSRVQKFTNLVERQHVDNFLSDNHVDNGKFESEKSEMEMNIEVDSNDDNDDFDDTWKPPHSIKVALGEKASKIRLRALAIMCDRYGISDRAGAAIANAVLEDLGKIYPENKTVVIDRSKLRRARYKLRKSLRNSTKVNNFRGFFFDGRKDMTLKTVIKGKTRRIQRLKEEHVSLVAEPGGRYIGHVSPAKGSCNAVTNEMMQFLDNEEIPQDFLALGSDGTNLMTGWKGGVMQAIEKRVKRPLQRLICLLHANELPFRHLFRKLDGRTTGPRAFKGPIGKALATASSRQVVKYKKIPTTLPVLRENLSTDQKYLYDICRAISTGVCSESLAMRYSGNISHSRWLNTANGVLRYYISESNPSENLVKLATYIMKVYAPTWFEIKTKSKCYNGASNLYKLISSSRYLEPELREIVDTVIERNSYFAHPENVLIGMLNDQRLSVRKMALKRILRARSLRKTTKVRIFKAPPINFAAKNYYDMIDWDMLKITEPPLTAALSETELKSIVDGGPKTDLFNLPCHTQAVERCVKVNFVLIIILKV